MSATILATTGTQVTLAVNALESTHITAQLVFKLDYNPYVFDENDFRSKKRFDGG